MTAQFKIEVLGGGKARRSARLDPSAAGRRSDSASGKPMLGGRVQNEFTVEEHLLVQRQIEERARRIWSANGFASQNPLDDWLNAEDEVLTEFTQARMQSRRMPLALRHEPDKTGNFQRKQ
jgi:hypothetical protein